MTTAHSPIGASTYKRWKACPGSIRLSKGIPVTAGAAAQAGTKAHEIAEMRLKGKPYPQGTDPEVKAAVDLYVDTIREETKGCKTHVEQKFDLSKLHPNLFGTADFVAFDPETKLLRVYDFKFGAGVPVEILENGEPNLQLTYYALGAAISLSSYHAREVEIVIVQPRCPHPDGPIRRHRFPSLYLIDFSADLIEAAQLTETPDAPLNPGDHCRFCPASGVCPALHEKALEVCREDFQPPFSYSPEKLSHVLSWLPTLKGYAKSVEEFAFSEALQGRCPPGFKLVEKRSTRKWRDEEETKKWLLSDVGLSEEDIFSKSLRSPAQIEKAIGRSKVVKAQIQEFTVNESSGVTLVQASDKRPSVRPDAAAEFTVIETSENE